MWYRRIFRLDNDSRKAQRFKSEGRSDAILLEANALRQLDRLQIRGSKSLRGDRIGLRSSYRGKPSVEFREHRMYVPGDDIRFLDWQASARHEQIFVRYGEMPKDVIVYLLIDCSASMAWGKRPKRESQIALASAMGYLALTNGDRLYIHPYGSRRNPEFGPASGKSTISSYIRYLSQLRYGGVSDLESAVRSLSQKVSRGGVLFILSDLLEKGDLTKILDAVPAPKWWVNILHLLHPAELDPELRGAYELQDSETGARVNYDLTKDAIKSYRTRLEDWQNQLELTAVEQHAFYTVVNTNWSLSKELLPFLRQRQVLVDK
jgi:uncharacterized protein (DUF58 family)